MSRKPELAVVVYKNGKPESTLSRIQSYTNDKVALAEARKRKLSFLKIYPQDDIKIISILRRSHSDVSALAGDIEIAVLG